jgi:hypothetical protein
MARPHGIFVVVETSQAVERAYAAAAAAGLRVLARIDIIPREDKPVLINVFVMVAEGASPYVSDVTSPADILVAASLFCPDGVSPYDVLPVEVEAVHPAATPPAEVCGAPLPVAEVCCAVTEVCASGTSCAGPEAVHLTVSTPAGDFGATPTGPDGTAPTAPLPDTKRKRVQQPCKRMPQAQPGEIVSQLCVRDRTGKRTPEYIALLRELGKPG